MNSKSRFITFTSDCAQNTHLFSSKVVGGFTIGSATIISCRKLVTHESIKYEQEERAHCAGIYKQNSIIDR